MLTSIICALLGALIGGGVVYLVMSRQIAQVLSDPDCIDEELTDEDDPLSSGLMSGLGETQNHPRTSVGNSSHVPQIVSKLPSTGLFVQEVPIADVSNDDDLAAHLVSKVLTEKLDPAIIKGTTPLPLEPPYLADLRNANRLEDAKMESGYGALNVTAPSESDLAPRNENAPAVSNLVHTTNLMQDSGAEPLIGEGDDNWVKRLRSVAQAMGEPPDPLVPPQPRFNDKS